KRELSDIDAFIFCEGPGSMLGIRTAAMALRTWSSTLKPVPSYAYRSLEVLARQLSLREAAPFSLVADARREMWHCVDVAGPTTISSLLRISSGEVKERTGKLFTPDTFRAWAALPPRAEKISYNISALMAPLSSAPLFREKPEPDAMLHEEPSYKTWVPQVHRASVQESIS
ncbi:MAG TPA: peptidase M22, partial [Opitutaceae bacterium]|nr:peptidase M22 [Opitutaceae bacterium]